MELSDLINNSSLSEIRRLEFKTRRQVSLDFVGRFRSAFRGVGLVFSDLREYQPGDDIRHIHWKATARSNRVYIKSYQEDRQLSVLLSIDVSSSTNFGKSNKHIRSLEFAALISLLCKTTQDAVGLHLFASNTEELLLPSAKRKQVHKILLSLMKKRDLVKETNLARSLSYLSENLKRPSLIFLVSDFYSPPFKEELRKLSIKHDVVCVCLEDILEYEFSKVGLVELSDPESGEKILVDTSSHSFSKDLRLLTEKHLNQVKDISKESGCDFISIKENTIRPLTELMNKRVARYR